VENCAIALESISNFIPELKKHLEQNPVPNYRRANIVVRSSTGDDAKVLWGGIGKRSCRLNPDDYLWTTLDGKKIFYSLDTFFQANLSILPKLFERIGAFDCWQTKPVLYDLYAGVGLFSLGLTNKTRKAILVEESLPSVKLAQHNIIHNRLTHMEVITGRVEDILPPLLARATSGIPKVAIIDPPRAGLSPQALETMVHTKEFTRLFYLSCNPKALERDLNGFIEHDWNIERIVPFDFFPKTRHVETLAVLTP
jgi:tRNA/tmRNA/rRNA uracil-C5-methylase (TrmA/RlmC/RlmD family)